MCMRLTADGFTQLLNTCWSQLHRASPVSLHYQGKADSIHYACSTETDFSFWGPRELSVFSDLYKNTNRYLKSTSFNMFLWPNQNFTFTFIRRFYPKRLTIAFRLYIFCQYLCSLGIKPTTICTADAILYHWATQEHFNPPLYCKMQFRNVTSV